MRNLENRDINAIACVDKYYNKVTRESRKDVLRITEGKLRKIKIKELWVDVLEIVGEFEDIQAVCDVLEYIHTSWLHINTPIILNERFNIPRDLVKDVVHLIIWEDCIECLDFDAFISLREVTIRNFTFVEPVHARLMKCPNIVKYTMKDCDFTTPEQMQDFIFGGNGYDEIIKTNLQPFIEDLSVINITATFNGIVFDLFSLTPNWFPNLKRLTVHNSPASLKPLINFVNLEYLELNVVRIKFDNVKTCPALKYLHLKAETIHIDKSISDFCLRSLTMSCKSLINKCVITKMPRCNTLQLVTRNGRLSKIKANWYYYTSVWHSISENDALKVINK